MAVIIIAIIILLFVAYTIHHQLLLKDRARLMREALHNRDFTFRLPTGGLLPGERALQDALNDFGIEVRQLVAQNEVESWQRLTRVLTHEIMNSVAPIASISQAYLNSSKIKDSGMEEGIRAIRDASQNMASFVESYRKLTQLQQPIPEDINLKSVIDSVALLYPDVKWNIAESTNRTIKTDQTLLRQVLVNIVKNAIEAGATAIDARWKGAIWLSNNGAPIMPEARKDIFVPFFTTKQSGSGIGLSLSRQIMAMQGQDLRISDVPQMGYSVSFVIE